MHRSLRFYKFRQPQIVSHILAKKIISHLNQGHEVLWLLSGGSAVDIALGTAHQLTGHNLSNLTVSLVDERYGRPGHPDSNWQQLIKQGLELKGANLKPVLSGSNIEQTTKDFEQFIKQAAARSDYKLALLGVGADGHTAGILPHSPALRSKQAVTFYDGPDYQRITLTPAGLSLIDEAVVFAQGESKAKALGDLSKNLLPDDQPAQLIKSITCAAVYNDLEGETI